MSEDRLLVIDDDAGFRNYVRRVGETAGFETLVTGDAASFKKHVRSWHPSVIVIDLNMPGADGIELLRDLVEAKSKARIVIASGVDLKLLETAERLASERGLVIAGTLQKPIRADLLRETLERLREFEKPLIAGALAHAIANDGLFLDYQPKLDCKSGQIFAVEALVRWQHPSRGIIPPDQFLTLAEQSGVIHALTAWVAGAAARQGAAWRQAGMPLEIAINVSPRDIAEIEFPDSIMAICQTAGLAADAVTLELTELAAMGDPAQALDVLTRLRLKGFRLSIDNYGTGYSSLAQLRRLPLSELKIDISFVAQMHRNPDSRVIVEAVIGLGHKLGLAVVAEGVESAVNLAAVVEMGADAAQGYFIGAPAGAERIAALVKGQADAVPPRPNPDAEPVERRTADRRSRTRRKE
jgi:EAL domain-containing protein (putative c-di-GMP-specific phosphodiesterase class I)